MNLRSLRRPAFLLLVLLLLFGCSAAPAEPLNILLIGADEADPDGNARSDAMILVRSDPQNAQVHMVSFLRDLYVSIPGHGKSRLNAAYTYGGEALLKQTLAENFGVAVDRTATVQFSLLSDLVDQLGGIDAEISSKELPELNRLLPAGESKVPQAGVQRLNGQQALGYTRIRKIDSDFQRTERQQKVISAMLRRASEMGYWDLLGLAVKTLSSIETDLTLGDITSLLPLVARLDEMEMASARVPFDGTYEDTTINGMMVLEPDLENIRTQLNEFLYGE